MQNVINSHFLAEPRIKLLIINWRNSSNNFYKQFFLSENLQMWELMTFSYIQKSVTYSMYTQKQFAIK